jgi:hypothetical protein
MSVWSGRDSAASSRLGVEMEAQKQAEHPTAVSGEKGTTMKRLRQRGQIAETTAWGVMVMCGLLGARQLPAQAPKAEYPRMAPIDQYLMSDRNAEIALARSAAPEAISRDAKILVLGRRGYETAVEGKNGFVCMVERGWTSAFDFPEVWNPKLRGAVCLNPPAARSLLPIVYKKTQMLLAGHSMSEIIDSVATAFRKKELPGLEPGAMSYMMSKAAYLTDEDGHNMAHVMVYVPLRDGADWGADLPRSPVESSSYWFPAEQANPPPGLPPIRVFTVRVPRWSDGTAATAM